jgi:hypothetical protein
VRLHDWFNLAVLAVLNAENLFYLATGRGFGVFYTSSMVYFLLDTVFVGVYPQSVKSPVVILAHHLCTALYMLIPHWYVRLHWCMAHCMLVEINTWLLIARRRIGGRAIEAGFYASWVALRNVYYPYLIYAFFREWRHETALCGSALNPILVAPVLQAFLTGLNYKWTWELVSKLMFPKQQHAHGRGGGASARGGRPSIAAAVAAAGGGVAKGSSKGGAAGASASGSEDGGDDARDQRQPRARRTASEMRLKAQLVSSGGSEDAFAGHL